MFMFLINLSQHKINKIIHGKIPKIFRRLGGRGQLGGGGVLAPHPPQYFEYFLIYYFLNLMLGTTIGGLYFGVLLLNYYIVDLPF